MLIPVIVCWWRQELEAGGAVYYSMHVARWPRPPCTTWPWDLTPDWRILIRAALYYCLILYCTVYHLHYLCRCITLLLLLLLYYCYSNTIPTISYRVTWSNYVHVCMLSVHIICTIYLLVLFFRLPFKCKGQVRF